MKVLLVHNRYQQPAGEERVFESEGALLAERGHAVLRFTMDNSEIDRMPGPSVAAATIWNRRSYREIGRLVRSERPDVAHFHNTFPLVSPAAYYAVARAGVPVVQTLHNYRLLCANGLLYRRGRACEKCVGKAVGFPGVVHGCYRGSRTASAGVVAMQTVHRILPTWRARVDVYVAVSRFARRKFIQGGLPASKIEVKPNHLSPDPGPGRGRGGYALYVGRLTPEKGIRTLLRAWRELGEALPLRVIGDGPLAGEVKEAERGGVAVRRLGPQPRAAVLDLLGEATCLVFPSELYENCPMVIVEALARGTPIVAAEAGAATELVREGRTGAFFPPGDAAALASAARKLVSRPQALRRMRDEARRSFLQSHSADVAYPALRRIYARAGVPPDEEGASTARPAGLTAPELARTSPES